MTSTNLPAARLTASQVLDTSEVNKSLRVLQGFLVSKQNLNTRAAYARDLSQLMTWCASYRVELLDLKRPHLDLYREALGSDRLSPASIARKLSSISAYFDYAVKARVVEDNPAASVERPTVSEDTPRTGLSQSEALALIEAARKAGRAPAALVALTLLACLRVSEALALNVEDIGREQGVAVVTVRRKGGKRFRVVLSEQALDLLSPAIKKGAGALVRGERGARWDRRKATRVVNALAKEIKLGRSLCCHDLRHAAITNALIAGAPLEAVQDFAGHSSPVTTQRYNRARFQLENAAALQLGKFLTPAE